jgi:hypothetical protein
MATYTTSYPGNLALQQEVWTLTLAEAQAVLPALDTRPGSYWETVVAKPTRRAKRAKLETVRVYTAGFSTGEFSNALHATGSRIG